MNSSKKFLDIVDMAQIESDIKTFLEKFYFVRAEWRANERDLTVYSELNNPWGPRAFKKGSETRESFDDLINKLMLVDEDLVVELPEED